MAGQGKQVGGLILVMLGLLLVCLACALPMWRETSVVGANIVNAQSVWDGLWLHCVFQSTGQMQCKRHSATTVLTADFMAGRAFTLLSILAGVLGFFVTLLGGGVANCSGTAQDTPAPPNTTTSRRKMSLLGGALCLLAGVLCLISVTWSASVTISVYNDPLVIDALKREVGSSIYIGWTASVMLLMGGTLICLVCLDKEESHLYDYSNTPYSNNYSLFSDRSSHMSTLRSDAIRSVNPLPEPQVIGYNNARFVPARYKEPVWAHPADFGL